MNNPAITPVPLYEMYGVSEDGRVWTRRKGEWRELVACSKGIAAGDYLKVKVYKDKHHRQVAVHILVAEVYHGERPSPMHVVDHIDHNKRNNHKDNLRWITSSENTRWAVRCGRFVPPIPRRKLESIEESNGETQAS